MQDNKVAEITTTQARGGNDIQDIPWERLSIKREEYRLKRLEQYRNFENGPFSGESSNRVKFNYIPSIVLVFCYFTLEFDVTNVAPINYG